MIEFIEFEVASEKKPNIICPESRYMGKFGISNLNRFEKTADKTTIIIKGFSKLHR